MVLDSPCSGYNLDKQMNSLKDKRYNDTILHAVMVGLDQLTLILNHYSEWFKLHDDPNVVWLYDTIKSTAQEARLRFYKL